MQATPRITQKPNRTRKTILVLGTGQTIRLQQRRQQGIGSYIVDFYCAERAFIIELDGDSHYTPEAIAYDTARTIFFTAKGFKVIRFSNLEIMQNKEGVSITLLSYLKKGNQDEG